MGVQMHRDIRDGNNRLQSETCVVSQSVWQDVLELQ